MTKYDVTSLGELLIDFTSHGTSTQGNPLFEANPGGAVCNVLAMLSNLGRRTAFIGRVGKDMFGDMLREALASLNIDISNLISDPLHPTALAFVKNLPDGDRRFSFYRSDSADTNLSVRDVNPEIIRESRIFHFGSLSSTHPVSREATRFALDIAQKNGVTISFDPNLRENLWQSLDAAKNEIIFGLSKCDILKISDNELKFLCGNSDNPEISVKELFQSFHNIKIVFLTCGKDGSSAFLPHLSVKCKTFEQIKAIDATGAGDTFTGCVLNYLLTHPIVTLDETDLKSMLTFANAAASLVTAKKGALKSMPRPSEIEALITDKK